MAKAPMARPTKFMRSETKNSNLLVGFLGYFTTRPEDNVAMIGEFIGTMMFFLFAFAGTQLANIETR